MLEEIEATAEWWANQIRRSMLNNSSRLDDKQLELINNFKVALKNVLTSKYEKHWYVEEPIRGSAYRSLAFDHCMDPSLLKAAEMCGMQLRRIESFLSHTRTVIIFVNPGEVKLMNIIGGSHKSHPEAIWQKGKNITNIPEPEINSDSKNKEETDFESDEEQQPKINPLPFGTYASPKGIVPMKTSTPTKPYEYSRYNQNLNYNYENNYYGQGQYGYPNLPYSQRPPFSNNF